MDVIQGRIYSCYRCRNHVSFHDDIIDKNFVSGDGRAFLFSGAVNVVLGRKEERNLITGQYTVRDVSCCNCRLWLGWKYERCSNPRHMWKEGKIVIKAFNIDKLD